jgi:hypothetical protein
MKRMQRKLRLRKPRAAAPSQPSPDHEAARRTHALLSKLDQRQWTVLDDIHPRPGIDHVLVGPGGVFVIASHKPPGPGVRVRDGVLWLRNGTDARTDRPHVAINRHVLDAARALHRDIRRRTGRGPVVHPVVVLWCEFPQGIAQSSQIAFVHGRDLATWLAERPRQLDEHGRALVVQTLNAIHDSGARSSAHAHHIPHIGPRHRAA